MTLHQSFNNDRARLVPLLMVLALLLPAALSLGAAPQADPDLTLLNPELRREWSSYSSDERLRVIIQFESPMTHRDWDLLDELGFQETWRYQVIDGAAGYLTARGVAQLSHYERTWWIEKDTLNEYALEVSTNTIRAQSNWQRIVLDGDGDPWEEDGVELPVDGSGVTIVVADTGIDATHPDLDYREKVIENKKADVDGQPWVEMPNTDNLFGHGTHCAGIAAGSGEASAGLRRGVAPGASLIGLGIGDPWETNEVGAFEWVYEHAAPPNPYNIRVITNSWGYESVDENWKDAVIQASQNVAYERNVAVIFAASNDGGDGSESRTNIYGNSPGMVSVAASYREGGGIAGFSSRGDRTDNSTWPDIAAPGVEIWAARDTTGFIVNAVAGDTNPYYTAISGTSMATPHVAGVAALLWQAAPSLRFSNTTDDKPVYDDEYLNNEWSYIHDIELILKLTSDFLEATGDNGVPAENEIGIVGRSHDFAQGYGQVNVERAVALALTVEEMRNSDPHATVWDALPLYQNIIAGGLATRNVNGVRQQVQMFQETTLRSESSWMGEYIVGPTVAWGQDHELFVPDATSLLVVDFFYDQMDYTHGQVGELDIFVEADGQTERLTFPDLLTPDGHKRVEIPTEAISLGRDQVWRFFVSGYATRVEYLVELSLVMSGEVEDDILDDPTLRPEQVALDNPLYTEYEQRHNLRVATKYYDLRYIEEPPPAGTLRTLTVESPDEGALITVYKAGASTIAEAAGTAPLIVDLPEGWYYAKGTRSGHWPAVSADFYLGSSRTIVLPSMVEQDLEVPYGNFLEPRPGAEVSGKTKVRLQLNDVVGLSSVTVNLEGAPIHSQELDGATETIVTFQWDTTQLDDGEAELQALIIDVDGNDVTLAITVEVTNEEDSNLYLILLFLGIVIACAGAFYYLKNRDEGVDPLLSGALPSGKEPSGGTLEAESLPAESLTDTPLEAEDVPLEAEKLEEAGEEKST